MESLTLLNKLLEEKVNSKVEIIHEMESTLENELRVKVLTQESLKGQDDTIASLWEEIERKWEIIKIVIESYEERNERTAIDPDLIPDLEK